MKLRQYLIFTASLAALVFSALAQSSAESFKIRAGIGYDYFSQEYRIDSLVSDTLEATLALSSTYFDELKGKLLIEYAPGARGSMLLSGRLEQSTNDFRFRGDFDTKVNLGRVEYRSDNSFDLRKDLESVADSSRSFWTGSSRNRIYFPIGRMSRFKTEIDGEIVQFAHPDRYSRDYSKLGGKLGLESGFGDFSSLAVDLFLTHRNVPDSLEWNYFNSGGEASLFWLRERGEANLYIRFERKDYDQPDDKDDFDRFEISAQNRIDGNKWLSFKQIAELEVVRFAAESVSTYDYTKISLAGLAGYRSLSATILVGPWLEWLNEDIAPIDESLLGAQDYRELGIQVEADYIAPQWGYFSLQGTLGRRNLTGSIQVESDFNFVRTDLMLDNPIWNGLKGSLLLSADWEWHETESEDIRMILFSGGLTYTF